MLDASRLHVFTVRSNPLYWQAPHRNRQRFARHMIDSGVKLVVIEWAYGEGDHVCEMDGATHWRSEPLGTSRNDSHLSG